MSSDVTSAILVKIIFPLSVIPCIYIRQNGFSLCYLLMFFFIPWINSLPSPKEMKKGVTGIFLKLSLTLNGLFFIAHLVSQIIFIMASATPLAYCSFMETLTRTIGIIPWKNLPVIYILRDIIPEFIMLLILLGVYIRCTKVAKHFQSRKFHTEKDAKKLFMANTTAKGCLAVLLALVAGLAPSFLGLFYLILSVMVLVPWACRKRIWRRILSWPTLLIVLAVTVLHLLAVYLLQFQVVQDIVMDKPLLSFFDLYVLTIIGCSDPRLVGYRVVKWEAYALPIALLLLYWLTASILHIILLIKKYLKTEGTDVETKDDLERSTKTKHSEFDWTYTLIDFVRTLRYMKYLDEAVTIMACACMMVWSVLFPGFLSLVLLLWASALCLFPRMKKRTLRSSPFLVGYAGIVYSVQYVYAIEYFSPMLHHGNMQELGIEYKKRKSHIFGETIFLLMFFVLLHQFMMRKELKRKGRELESSPEEKEKVTAAKNVPVTSFLMILQVLRYYLVILWIVVFVTAMVVVICTGSVITLFRILFLLLFVFFVLIFEFSFDGWRKMLPAYCLTVGVFTLSILLMVYVDLIYTEDEFWKTMNIDKGMLIMIGTRLRKENIDIIMMKYSFVLIATMVQIQFNEDFMSIIDVRQKLRRKRELDTTGKMRSNNNKCEACIGKTFLLTAKYLEAHGYKFLFLFLIFVIVFHVSVFHFVLLITSLIYLLMKHTFRDFMEKLILLIVCLHSLQWMAFHLYQYQPVHFPPESPCRKEVIHNFKELPIPTDIWRNFAMWIGVYDPSGDTVAPVIWLHVGYLLIVLLLATCARYVQFKSFMEGEYRRYRYMIFPELTREDADSNCKNCMKFFVNFFFYKFGVEICFIVTMLMIVLRRDAIAVLYLLWLYGLFALKRTVLSKVWVFFVCFATISIICQYFSLLEPPPNYCFDFPWFRDREWRIIQEWCFLPGPLYPPLRKYLIYEIVTFIFLTRQRVVFSIEQRYGSFYPGGSNEELIDDIDDPEFVNAVPDFVTFTRSWLDIWKKFFFSCIFWVTLIVVFLAGTTDISIFSLGYLIGAFVLFWKGEDFFLFSMTVIKHDWNLLIAFNISVILCKVVLQFAFNLVFIYDDPYTCLCLRLFSIGRRAPSGSPAQRTNTLEETCIKAGDSKFAVHITVFIFIILARRAFTSYYFVHIINDYKATYFLSSRGAALFEQLRLREVALQEDKEQEVLEEIAKKMEDLREKQRMLNANPFFVSPQSHYEAILSGDYFFFDEKDIEADDVKRQYLEDLMDKEKELECRRLSKQMVRDNFTDEDEEDSRPRRMTLTELWAETMRYRMSKAVTKARQKRGARFVYGLQEEKDEGYEDRISEASVEYRLSLNNEDSKKKKNKITCRSTKVICYWLYELIEAGVMSFALTLYNLTNNYRFVVRELAKQKKRILATGALRGERDTRRSPWTPVMAEQRDRQSALDSSFVYERSHVASLSFNVHMQSAAERAQLRFLRASHQKSAFFTLMYSFMYLVMANTELICYFLIVLHQMLEPTMVSLLMTFAMLFIGVLSSPRPSMTFWVCLMAYAQVVVVVKSFLSFIHATSDKTAYDEHDSDYYSNVNTMALIGLEKDVKGSSLDLLLILFILIHRYRMKKFGLWGKNTTFTYETIPRSSKSRSPMLPETVAVLGDRSTTSMRKRSVIQKSEKPEKFNTYYPATVVLLVSKYRQRVRKFYLDLLSTTTRSKTDVYKYLFFMEAGCFLHIFAFVEDFTEMQRNWYWYFSTSRVPVTIFVLLFGQFMMIIIDRIIYVRKSVLAKLIYYHIQIIIVHCILFFFLPITIQRRVNASPVLQVFYFAKCVYFLLSAYQIRRGYDLFAHGYLFRNKFNIATWAFHIVYMQIPFFNELRNIIDWSSSDSSLTISEWFKLEDIFNHIYDIKCTRMYERVWVKIRGQPNTITVLVTIGGGLLLLVILLLWFPLVIFIIKHNFGKANVPVSIQMGLSVETYPALFRGRSFYKRAFTQSEWEELRLMYKSDVRAAETTGYFKPEDIVIFKISTLSLNWDITADTRGHLTTDLENKEEMFITLYWMILYESSGYNTEISGRKAVLTKKGDDIRTALIAAMGGAGTVAIPSLLPKFLDATHIDLKRYVGKTQSLGGFLTEGDSLNRDISLTYDGILWTLAEVCSGKDWEEHLQKLPEAGCEAITVYIFSEKRFGFWMDDISSLSAQSLYIIILFSTWAIFRGLWRLTIYRLHILEIPYPDRIMQLCNEVRLVRLAKVFELEEDLFAKLYFLFRSTETLILFTRRPKNMRREVPENEPTDFTQEQGLL